MEFLKTIRFFRQFYKKFYFSGKNFRMTLLLQNFRYPYKIGHLYSYFWANYSISLQNSPLSTYFLYMIRYNRLLFQDPSTTPTTPLRPPKSGGQDPQPPGFTPMRASYIALTKHAINDVTQMVVITITIIYT